MAREETLAARSTGHAAPVTEDELERGSAFRALYAHWERNQWSPLELDLSTDAATFAALDAEERRGFLWVFAHRFHAEYQVASLLAPLLEHAPDWDMQLLIATQIADEHRHMQSVLRIYDEVLGIEGGISAARARADENWDPIALALNDAFEEQIARLAESGDEDDYLRASVSYHVLAEGVVARCAQHLTEGQYARFGDFPGLTRGQAFVSRDEARHIGIGVSYVRRRLAEDRDRALPVVSEIIEGFAELAADLYEKALGGAMDQQVLAGYGVEIDGFYEEAMRLFQLRMRSIGYIDADDAAHEASSP